MSLLTIKCDKHFIIVIIFWILEITLRLMLSLKSNFFTFTQDIIKKEYMFVIFLNAADLLSGFLVLYSNQSSKTGKNKEKNILSNKVSKSELIYEEFGQAPKKNYYKKVIIIIILDYINCSFFWISYAITGVKDEEVSHLLENEKNKMGMITIINIISPKPLIN